MFTPYPAITQSDPMQQMLGQVMGGYKPNQLGAGVTLGNPEAQQDYIAQLAQALADGEFSAKQIEQAGSLLTPEFIQNSGLAGVADMVLKTYVGKKMDEKGRTLQADAETRRMTAQEGVDERKAAREAARSDAVSTRERSRRDVLARQMELNNRERLEFVETGKVPEAKRDRLQAVQSSQGLAIANLDQNSYTLPGQDTGQQLPPNVHIDPNLSPEDRAIALADAVHNQSAPHGETVDYGTVKMPQQGGPLMPYEKPPSAIELEKMDLMRRSAARADSAESRAAAAAERAAAAAEKKANAPNAALGQWVEARKGLEEGLGRTETGPLVGRIPAFTTDQQIAEGSVAVTAPILKQLFRTAGEGTFTDKDQELLMQMVPTRNDTEEARKWKIENMDRVIRAKLGAGAPAPAAADSSIDDIVNKYRGK